MSKLFRCIRIDTFFTFPVRSHDPFTDQWKWPVRFGPEEEIRKRQEVTASRLSEISSSDIVRELRLQRFKM